MRFRRRPAGTAEQAAEPTQLNELADDDWRGRGDEYARSGDWQAAAREYGRGDEAGDGRAAADLGVLHEYDGDLDAAQAAYARADERGDGLGAMRLGLLLARRGEWDAAEAAYKRADERGGAEEDDFDLEALIRAGAAAAPAGDERRQSALANPVMVGAVTVLAALLGVFLAYNSNQGLPFVPTRELKVQISDGSNLVVGNDVSEGGFHVGQVSGIAPARLGNGRIAAVLTLQLAERDGSVPVDSTVTIRSRSVLGLKYVDLHRGSSSRTIADGGTLPISQAHVPVQIDQVFNMFDPPTRTAIQNNLQGYGDTFTGRGSSINDLIYSLPPLLGNLRPVARYLSDPGTGLTRFFNATEALVRTIAPVSPTLSRLFGDMATTFAAISSDPGALERTIAQSPSTLAVSTDSLRAQQPFLTDFAVLGRALTPATRELNAALPHIDPAIEAGTRTLARTPILNRRLQGVMSALRSLALSPGTNVALNGLRSTVSTLNPVVRYVGPYQTVCNDFNYFWTFLQDNVSEATSFGTAQRIMAKLANSTEANNVGTPGAAAPVNGGATDSLLGGNEFLHNQSYGAAILPNGAADCETGQRGYPHMLNHFDPQHRDIAVEAHTPGSQGPTYEGLARVPAGETFSRNPTSGPQLPSNPTNP